MIGLLERKYGSPFRGRDGKQGSRGKRLLGGLWERKTGDDGLSHLR